MEVKNKTKQNCTQLFAIKREEKHWNTQDRSPVTPTRMAAEFLSGWQKSFSAFLHNTEHNLVGHYLKRSANTEGNKSVMFLLTWLYEVKKKKILTLHGWRTMSGGRLLLWQTSLKGKSSQRTVRAGSSRGRDCSWTGFGWAVCRSDSRLHLCDG